MADRYDAVIIGAGPGGEVALNTLLKAGRKVALIESEVIGGECSNWGCIPSKTLLRPTELEGKHGIGDEAEADGDEQRPRTQVLHVDV